MLVNAVHLENVFYYLYIEVNKSRLIIAYHSKHELLSRTQIRVTESDEGDSIQFF